ncbi:ArgP/LysG family DNA-binding transcriptional regulator [Demequina muriae]|uniref:ArgP/LysG family DNA-binding transcriptional regulator n=1 Tax=Demequina muriae TaxID=3051664 RepID=A0ABT8GIF3_9MICO|nr:ArgP/LysG family DNA-binding transcriptional regulator [Demequina sp. EGI L300058]MDN4481056.1 ArgP/LysG family DNA-binding transcriptional regulator [Demequina sp. EGI L300058]
MKVPPDLAATLAAAVSEGSLEGAARALHVSQPAVTQRIQALEKTVGQVLLVRSRPVRATAAGEAVIRYARQVEHLERDLGEALGVETQPRPSVAIAVNGDSLATWFLEPLAVLADELGVTFQLHREDEGRTADLLSDGTVAAAVTTRSAPVPGCTVTRLGDMRYGAFASQAFAAQWFPDGVSAPALSSAPVVDVDEDDALQTRFLRAHDVDPHQPPRHRIPGSSEMVRAIELGMGWAVLPPALGAQAAGLVELGGPIVTVPLHWQQWRVRSALLDRIAAEVAAAASTALGR